MTKKKDRSAKIEKMDIGPFGEKGLEKLRSVADSSVEAAFSLDDGTVVVFDDDDAGLGLLCFALNNASNMMEYCNKLSREAKELKDLHISLKYSLEKAEDKAGDLTEQLAEEEEHCDRLEAILRELKDICRGLRKSLDCEKSVIRDHEKAFVRSGVTIEDGRVLFVAESSDDFANEAISQYRVGLLRDPQDGEEWVVGQMKPTFELTPEYKLVEELMPEFDVENYTYSLNIPAKGVDYYDWEERDWQPCRADGYSGNPLLTRNEKIDWIEASFLTDEMIVEKTIMNKRRPKCRYLNDGKYSRAALLSVVAGDHYVVKLEDGNTRTPYYIEVDAADFEDLTNEEEGI